MLQTAVIRFGRGSVPKAEVPLLGLRAATRVRADELAGNADSGKRWLIDWPEAFPTRSTVASQEREFRARRQRIGVGNRKVGFIAGQCNELTAEALPFAKLSLSPRAAARPRAIVVRGDVLKGQFNARSARRRTELNPSR